MGFVFLFKGIVLTHVWEMQQKATRLGNTGDSVVLKAATPRLNKLNTEVHPAVFTQGVVITVAKVLLTAIIKCYILV
jgi:hypothetical protein